MSIDRKPHIWNVNIFDEFKWHEFGIRRVEDELCPHFLALRSLSIPFPPPPPFSFRPLEIFHALNSQVRRLRDFPREFSITPAWQVDSPWRVSTLLRTIEFHTRRLPRTNSVKNAKIRVERSARISCCLFMPDYARDDQNAIIIAVTLSATFKVGFWVYGNNIEIYNSYYKLLVICIINYIINYVIITLTIY